jgi:opacity protein-like surface antigen
MVRTEFESFYAINDLPQNAHHKDKEKTGTRYGLGADIPADENVFVRLDYSYTGYNDIDADIVTETEQIDPGEALFRLGLGWRFGGQGTGHSATPVKVAGGYAGAHVGHGALQSDVSGIHSDSDGAGGAVASDFDGDFGFDSGFTGGVFLGYGVTYANWYLGVEGELEDSTLHWDHVRDPQGRNFSVDKKDTRGLGIRGGYVLVNGALLYARAGQVRTRFNTTWIKGANRNNDIDRDDTVTGTRYGVGAELPVTRTGFVRMDYTFTDYHSYSFVTAHGNADDMDFDNSETLFRLGLGARF